MRSSIISRPTKGRQNKVTKPGSVQQQQPRGLNLRNAQQLLEGQLDEAHAFVGDEDVEIADDDDVAAAADIEQQNHQAAAVAAAASHVQGISLGTAADILSNGGVSIGVGQPGVTAVMMAAQDQTGLPPQLGGVGGGGGGGGPIAGGGMPGGPHNMDQTIVKTTEELAHDSGYGGFIVESALAKRFGREPGLRLAQQRRPEQQLNLGRRSNVEALFAHIAGELAPAPCKNCHKGHGPWNCCVVLDGQMCGSCANCWFNASGARCSFHETRTSHPQLHPHHPALLASSSTASLPSDPSASFSLSQSMAMGPPASVGPTLQNPAAGPLLTGDPLVRYTVDRAVAEVRAADRRTRELIAIEVRAKQLALQIVDYEEAAARDEAQSARMAPPQPQQQQQQQPGAGVLGDEAPS